MRLGLTIEGGTPKTVNIDQDIFTIGRSPKSDIQINHESISRSHLRVRAMGGQIFIMDLGTSNGTFVNFEKLTPNEEIQWQTFFPIFLGEKVTINFISSQNETLEEIDSGFNRPSSISKNTETKIQRPTRFNAQKVSEKKTTIKPIQILLILAIGMGALFYHYTNQEDELKETPTATYGHVASHQQLIQEISLLEKCQGEKIIGLCQELKMNRDRKEGIIFKNNELFIFVNFKQRLSHVELDPSFSFAPEEKQFLYLMTYLAFGDEIRSYLAQNNFTFLRIIAVSADLKKASHFIRISQNSLTRLTSTDVESIFTDLLNHKNELFNSLILPHIETYYAK